MRRNLFDHPIAGSVYINDATIIFEDVFVPNERIFLKGEWDFAGQVAHMFANFHRLSAETYKAMELELFTGAAALMAEYNGVEKVPHIREKLTWLVMYTEAVEVHWEICMRKLYLRAGFGFGLPQSHVREYLQILLCRQLASSHKIYSGYRRRYHGHLSFGKRLHES